MRITSNIMAMNTHRSYGKANDKISLSAERLSSGYRINRAADDAAGLAISEKMRAQIRGLNMAARNTQDGISLIQTAEGALAEAHSILQRMNELSIESATGTNQEFDRAQTDKEWGQLKREINDIAEQTTFNNMRLLDGSLSSTGIRRSAEMAGIVSGGAEAPPMGNAVNHVRTAAIGEAGQFEITCNTADAIIADGTSVKLDMSINGDWFSVTAESAAGSGTKTGDDVLAVLDGAVLQGMWNEDTYRIEYTSGSKLTIYANQPGRIDEVQLISFSTHGDRLNFAHGVTAQGSAGTPYGNLEWKLDKVVLDNPDKIADVGDRVDNGSTDPFYRISGTVKGIRIDMTIAGARAFFDVPDLPAGSNADADTWFGAYTGGVQGKTLDGSGNVTGTAPYELRFEDGHFILKNTEPPGSNPYFTNNTVRSFNIQYLLLKDDGTEGGLDILAPGTNTVTYITPYVQPENFTGQAQPRSFTTDVDVFTGKTLEFGELVRLDLSVDGESFILDQMVGWGGAGDEEQIAALFSGKSVQLASGERFTARVDPSDRSKLIWVSDSIAEVGAPVIADPKMTLLRFDSAPADEAAVFPPDDKRGWTLEVAANDMTFENGIEGIKKGDILELDGKRYEIVAPGGGKAHEDTIAVMWGGATAGGFDAFAARLYEAMGGDAAAQFDVAGYSGPLGSGITITQKKDAAGDVRGTFTSSASWFSTLEFDPARLESGDRITVGVTDQYGRTHEALYTHEQGNSTSDIYSSLRGAFGDSVNMELDGNLIKFHEAFAGVSLEGGSAGESQPIRIQVGALEGEQLAIDIRAISTADLGLDGVTIASQDEAGQAITATKKAIDIVSGQRALLGAMQNRLEDKTANLKCQAENLQAAEGRIRDADISSEMAEFTKATILAQAATAMLAQANANPQNVLSLLR